MSYEQNAATATKLLTKFGKSVTLRQSSAPVYDETTSSTAAAVVTDTVLKGAVFDLAEGVTSIRGTMVAAGDRQIYLEAKSGVVPKPDDQLIDGLDVYQVVSVGELNPAGVPVMYTLHVRL